MNFRIHRQLREALTLELLQYNKTIRNFTDGADLLSSNKRISIILGTRSHFGKPRLMNFPSAVEGDPRVTIRTIVRVVRGMLLQDELDNVQRLL
jgi:hypothetical protein